MRSRSRTAMTPGVTQPKVVSEVKAQYTPEAMQARIEGTVIMTAVVRTDGTPADIEITESLDTEYGLDKQAVAALSQWRFEPGLKGGKPVPVRVTVEMRFTAEEVRVTVCQRAPRRSAIGGGIQSAWMPRSPRITWAALYPGSPVMLPPGWLLDPHR